MANKPEEQIEETTEESTAEKIAANAKAAAEAIKKKITGEQEPSKEEQIAALSDKILRLNAEIENMRKRYQKQIEDASSFAVANFAKDLIPVMDNLTRSLQYFPTNETENPELKNIYGGIEMTKNELMQVFSKYAMVEVSPQKGEAFDYNYHQAMSYVAAEQEPNTIVDVLQHGYKLKERLLRPAMVIVAKAKE